MKLLAVVSKEELEETVATKLKDEKLFSTLMLDFDEQKVEETVKFFDKEHNLVEEVTLESLYPTICNAWFEDEGTASSVSIVGVDVVEPSEVCEDELNYGYSFELKMA